MTLRKSLVAALALAALVGCGKMDSHALAQKVREEMQRDLVKDKSYSELLVEDVKLVHREGYQYAGVATGRLGDVPVTFDVTCTYDGASVLWKADLRDAVAVFSKVTGREIKETASAAWDEAKGKAASAWSSTREAVKSGYGKTLSKVNELCTEAKEKLGSAAGETASEAPATSD